MTTGGGSSLARSLSRSSFLQLFGKGDGCFQITLSTIQQYSQCHYISYIMIASWIIRFLLGTVVVESR